MSPIRLHLLLVVLLALVMACDQRPGAKRPTSNVAQGTSIPLDEKKRLITELIKSVRIEIEGVGEFRLVDSDWTPKPGAFWSLGDTIEIRFPEGLRIRLSVDELDRPAGIKKMAVRFPPGTWVDPGESAEIVVSADVNGPNEYGDFFARIWDSNPDQPPASSGSSHPILSITKFSQSEYVLDWSMDVDRRDPENTIVQVMLLIDPDIQEQIRFLDIDSMGFRPIMMQLPLTHPVVYGRSVWPWADPPISFAANPNLKEKTPEMELLAQSKNFGPKGIKFVAQIRIGTPPGAPIAGVGLSGGYSYDPSSSEYREYVEKVQQGLIEAKPGMLARLRVPIPNFSEPILRFTPEHRAGIPITPEELKELEQSPVTAPPAQLGTAEQDASP